MPAAPKKPQTRNNRPVPVRLDLVRTDLYRMARDQKMKTYLRISAARVLLQYAEVEVGDKKATEKINKLFNALSAKPE